MEMQARWQEMKWGVFYCKKWKMGSVFCKKVRNGGCFVKKVENGGGGCKKVDLSSTQGALCIVSVFFLFYILLNWGGGGGTHPAHPLPTGLSLDPK